MKNANIIIVDDNKSILSALELLLKGRCARVKCLSSPNLLPSELQRNSYDVLLLDMNFSAGINSGNEGIYWLQRIIEQQPELSVVMITAYGDVELAVKAVRMGAFNFILKPWENGKMLSTVESACRLSQSRKEVYKLKQKEQHLIAEMNKPGEPLIGSSDAWNDVMQMVAKVAPTKANVLITGENGTGKDLVARAIHRLSARSSKVMVTVDMGAVTETLFESELFGHKKGAFTDAHTDRTGKIELANGGTLFLDEIGNLSVAMQSKLLSALQNRSVVKVGDNKASDVDIRLVCATNCNLQQMVANGEFREDLFYRINTIHIEIPSLRNRIDDIPKLSMFFLKRYVSRYHKNEMKLSNAAIDKLTKYKWPGNVRELQHAIEKAVILNDSGVLQPADFLCRDNEKVDSYMPDGTLEEMEQNLIASAIKKQDGNMTLVAKHLGITRQTLYNKIKKYGL